MTLSEPRWGAPTIHDPLPLSSRRCSLQLGARHDPHITLFLSQHWFTSSTPPLTLSLPHQKNIKELERRFGTEGMRVTRHVVFLTWRRCMHLARGPRLIVTQGPLREKFEIRCGAGSDFARIAFGGKTGLERGGETLQGTASIHIVGVHSCDTQWRAAAALYTNVHHKCQHRGSEDRCTVAGTQGER